MLRFLTPGSLGPPCGLTIKLHLHLIHCSEYKLTNACSGLNLCILSQFRMFRSLSIINKYFFPQVWKTVSQIFDCLDILQSHSAKVHYLSFVITLTSPHSLIVFFSPAGRITITNDAYYLCSPTNLFCHLLTSCFIKTNAP